MKRASLDDEDEYGSQIGPGQSAGCHPLKNLRRQAIDEFEDEFMTQGRPAAKVVNMREKQPEVEVKPVEREIPQPKMEDDGA